MNLYCDPNDLVKIKENKTAFINNLIGLNIPFDVCGVISAAMNQAINKIETGHEQESSEKLLNLLSADCDRLRRELDDANGVIR